MAKFNIKWDGMGFTDDEKMTSKELSEADAAALTVEMRAAGLLPANVVSIVQARVSADDGSDEDEWKVFVSIELVVEAASMHVAECAAAPEKFLLLVADKMVKGDADAIYDIRNSFEVLEVRPEEDGEMVLAGWAPVPLTESWSIFVRDAVPGQWLTYDDGRQSKRIVEVAQSRDGRVEVYSDFGSAGTNNLRYGENYAASDIVRVASVQPAA